MTDENPADNTASDHTASDNTASDNTAARYDAEDAPPVVVVADAPERSEYVATIDGDDVGVLKYERRSGVIDLQHTIVDEAAGGRGVGTALIRDALDQARAAGVRVVPTCPFVQRFLATHEGYGDLVAPAG